MAAVRGNQLVLKRGDGAASETFTTVGAMQSKSLQLNGNPIDVTTADDVDGNDEIWQTFITGLKTLSVSGNGIAKSAASIQPIYNDFAVGNITNYEITVPHLGTFTVAMIVASINHDAPHDGVVGFQLELNAAGAPTFVAET